MGVQPHKFGLDMDVRWNFTYLMLKHLIPYKSIFSVFIHTHYAQEVGQDGQSQTLLTPAYWDIGEKILHFLELFYDCTCTLSGIYYPTFPIMLHNIIEIAEHLNNYEKDNLLRSIIVPMKTKFLLVEHSYALLLCFYLGSLC
jgi:hypothetical protein